MQRLYQADKLSHYGAFYGFMWDGTTQNVPEIVGRCGFAAFSVVGEDELRFYLAAVFFLS